MTTQSITQGQRRQIISVVEAAAGNAAEELLAKFDLDRKEAQRLLGCGDQVKVAVQMALQPVINRLIGRYPLLVETRLLKPVKTAIAANNTPYVASLLKKNACDTDIRKELPENHLSTLEDIAGFIEAQLNGKSDLLLNNGWANIFYVEGKNGEVFAVSVRWHSDFRDWNVLDWKLDELGEWSTGRQVLCLGTVAL